MSGLEVNKILAAIIMAVLIVFLITNIGDFLAKVIMAWGLYVWTLSAPNSDCQKLRPNFPAT